MAAYHLPQDLASHCSRESTEESAGAVNRILLTNLPQSLIQPNLFRYKLDRLLLASRRTAFRETGTWLSKRAYERADKGDDVEEKDMFYAMMHAVDPKTNKSFNRKDMWTESVLLLFSGKSSACR